MKRRQPSGAPAQTTKVRILDAAEDLFAQRGYDGVSLRDIAQLAQVEVALLSYHFGPKQELFQHVISRRAEPHCARVLAALDAEVLSARDGVVPIERSVYAFCRSTFDLARRRDRGWKRYLQLVARSAVFPVSQPALKPLHAAYGPVVRRYVASFRAGLPTLREAELYTAFYWLQAIVSRMIAETGILDRQSHGLCRAADYDAHLARAVPFCTAGFRALARAGPRPRVGPVRDRALAGRSPKPGRPSSRPGSGAMRGRGGR